MGEGVREWMDGCMHGSMKDWMNEPKHEEGRTTHARVMTLNFKSNPKAASSRLGCQQGVLQVVWSAAGRTTRAPLIHASDTFYTTCLNKTTRSSQLDTTDHAQALPRVSERHCWKPSNKRCKRAHPSLSRLHV